MRRELRSLLNMTNDIKLYIATAKKSGAAKWRNTKTTWAKVAESLSQTERTKETLKQYFSYTTDRQGEIKDVGGFVGGKLMAGTAKIKGKDVTFVEPYGWRRKGFVEHRQLVALDVDFGDMDTWLDFKLLEVAGLMYTTHKHTTDNPRFRIVFPLDRPVSPEEYECIARVVASWLNIEVFDDTTYQPTRLMYYPSTARDGEFIYDVVDAPLVKADDVLGELDDWTDVTTWPTSSREKEVRRATADQVEDPIEKHGIVGAFCRAYTMEEAIAEFLGDVYRPCEELGDDRYSYVSGSTSGGLIIYDHKLAFSHHNTDPAGGKLCNAFDLVRLHKFGDLDEKAKPDTESTKLPSYRAMADFAGGLKEVKKEVVRERRERQGAEYDDAIEEAREVGDADEWIGELEMEGKKIKNTIDNVVRIFTNDANLKGCFGFNEFEQRECIVKQVLWDKNTVKYPRPIIDSDDAELRLYFERCYDITSTSKITDGLTVVVRANSYHPIKDYLDACVWDGVERLDTLLIDALGAPDTAYTRAITRKFFVAGVARIYRPGVKFDNMLTIIGEQGIGKSTLFDRMGGPWFSDSITSINDNKALEALQGSWVIEMGEMTGLKEVRAVKHFVAKREDRYRIAYGKRLSYFPRQCIFGATSNEDDPLRDTTGNRRYWVSNTKGGTITKPVWDYLDEVTVAQLWAEAKERYTQGEELRLPGELEEEAREIQDAHLEKDDRLGLIQEYLERQLPGNWDKLQPYERRQWLTDETNEGKGTVQRTTVCIMEVWAECLGKDPENITRRDSLELGRALKALRDWHPDTIPKRLKYYGKQKVYVYTGLPKDWAKK